LEATRRELEAETAKRAKLEQTASGQKVELVKVKDLNVKMERELKKALKDLKDREWEVKQLESKQDKTIVEHVHVLEEAKKVTDRQLDDAKKELASNAAYIRSLEKAKTRLTGEAEDLYRQTEKERLEIRNKERSMKSQEEKASRALAEVDKERKNRELAELQSRRLEIEMQSVKTQVQELTDQLQQSKRSKENLEAELERIAADAETDNSLAQFQRDYEARIGQLEKQLAEAESSRSTSSKLKERIERQHEEIRQLIMKGGKTLDDGFQMRLLQELQLADEMLEKELKSRRKSRSRSRPRSSIINNDLAPVNNHTPTKKKPRVSFADMPKVSEREVSALKQQVEVLEIQMVASDRVRQHLENSLKELMAEMENLDGSKQSVDRYRQHLTLENERLSQLLMEEAEARRASEAAQFTGVQEMWAKFQDTIAMERDNYARLEESRKALVRDIHLWHATSVYPLFVGRPTKNCTE
jgi:myosin heavy chain 9/10/11/14